MASADIAYTFTHTPDEIHVNPADYHKMINAYAEEYPGKMFPIPFVADPDVPQGTLRGVGLGVFTDEFGHKIERRIQVTYKTGVKDVVP